SARSSPVARAPSPAGRSTPSATPASTCRHGPYLYTRTSNTTVGRDPIAVTRGGIPVSYGSLCTVPVVLALAGSGQWRRRRAQITTVADFRVLRQRRSTLYQWAFNR